MATNPCARCGRMVAKGFVFTGSRGPVRKCLRCALCHGPLLRRSLWACLVVGTILTAINQGTVLVGSPLPGSLAWKVPLTYSVPFLVAAWGALSNSRA